MKNNRMLKIMKALEEKKEVFLDEKKKEINEKALEKEFKRLKTLSEDMFRSSDGPIGPVAPGQTVNSILNPQDLSSGGPNYPGVKNLNANLQPNEALEVSIRRTLSSGAPINDLDFYDEVNWHLVNLGFNPQPAVMIKEVVASMMNK